MIAKLDAGSSQITFRVDVANVFVVALYFDVLAVL